MTHNQSVVVPMPRSGLFPLGAVVLTSGVLQELGAERAGQAIGQLLARHALGDWGELAREDWAENDYAILEELRILSAYTVAVPQPGGGQVDVRIWIITEADRSATTILLPDEY